MTADRERNAQKFFWALIIVLLIGYGILKTRHILVALDAFQNQPITTNTSGAAN